MEGLSIDTKKELTGSAAEILKRIDKVDRMLSELKEDIEKKYGDASSSSPLFTKKEVCQLLKISRVTLHKLISSGEIKILKVGGKSIRIHEDALKSFISYQLAHQ
jgi:excisionase family DNA binding protein